MPPPVVAGLLLLAAYLVGAIPFGYVVGRLRGVNLFRAGSGNIGATNTGRVLGRKYGSLVFVLDFLKGAVPVAAVVPLAAALAPGAETELGPRDVLRVGAAGLAFLGHLFPVYLGFRGGKGVATGAGTIAVLVPGPAALAILAWVVVLLASRIVSLASLAAVTILVLARLIGTPTAFTPHALPVTLYLLAGATLVILKHRSNIARLAAGTESRVGDFTMRQPALRTLHVLALGIWFGGSAFFNFVAAPLIFESFKQVVDNGPSDRTANETIIPADASAERKKDLASALSGAAVGPVFPWYFGMQVVCAVIALVTAYGWRNAEPTRRVHRFRFVLLIVAVIAVGLSWSVGDLVTHLRVLRFSPDPGTAAAARANFGPWHMVSLALSFVTVVLAGIALALAARLPPDERPAVATGGH